LMGLLFCSLLDKWTGEDLGSLYYSPSIARVLHEYAVDK
jgi:hypothetical protein